MSSRGSDALASVKQMLRDDMLKRGHWPLSSLNLCVACNEVSLLGDACPACGDRGSLLTLSRVLDRERRSA
jgi:hypothetical protein